MTFGPQIARLRSHGCKVANVEEIELLKLGALNSVAQVAQHPKVQNRRITALKSFLQRLQTSKPDLVIMDRLLIGAQLAVQQLDIPYLSIGTPGGYWRFDDRSTLTRANIFQENKPITSYQKYSETLKRSLAWPRGGFGSAWVHSPYGNLHFMPSDFYPSQPDQKSRSLHHHSTCAAPKTGHRLGLSFGNQGDISRFQSLVETLIENRPSGLGVDIFAGSNQEVKAHFDAFTHQSDMRVFGWTEFSKVMPNLSSLVFLGGVGSIWHCIEHGIPMMIAPGHTGDQVINAQRVAALGMGLHLDDGQDDKATLASVMDLSRLQVFSTTVAAYAAPEKYSTTLEGYCDRIGLFDF
ncbi:MAG: glycosyltransferase [Pelagimonas sp.]|uniref:glycosyltransferase n=1 Tax=Pelagimonas sp. TaxID=2073170 RepID=UPI003D6B0BFB